MYVILVYSPRSIQITSNCFRNSQRLPISTTVPSTVKASPQKPPNTPPTPFLRSESEVRFAPDSDFAFDSDGEKRVPPLSSNAPAVAVPNTSTNNRHFSPNPNQYVRAVDTPQRQNTSNIHFGSNPNDCYRLAPRQIQLPTRPNEREDGKSIPLRGKYFTVLDDDPDDAELDKDPPPGLDDDLSTAMCNFAWAYVKGLGGLVMGVLDGLARGDGGPARYMTYSASACEGARR